MDFTPDQGLPQGTLISGYIIQIALTIFITSMKFNQVYIVFGFIRVLCERP